MKPILFSTPMVQALLNIKPGTWPAEPIDSSRPCKSQTRRVVEDPPCRLEAQSRYRYDGMCNEPDSDDAGCHYMEELTADGEPTEKYFNIGKARYQAGDRLWVRETFYDGDMQGKMIYRADGEHDCDGVWKPSIHMPREAARLFLEVREVRVERLQDICHEGVTAEGIQQKECGCEVVTGGYCTVFREFWNAVNGKGAWESNPWVFVYEFMRVEG